MLAVCVCVRERVRACRSCEYDQTHLITSEHGAACIASQTSRRDLSLKAFQIRAAVLRSLPVALWESGCLEESCIVSLSAIAAVCIAE